MDFSITRDGADADMSFTPTDNLDTAVFLSIEVTRGSFFAAPSLGSRFHLLRREKNLSRVIDQAEAYAVEALQWLVDLGRATSVTATAALVSGRLKLAVAVVQANGRELSYETFVEVI